MKRHSKVESVQDAALTLMLNLSSLLANKQAMMSGIGMNLVISAMDNFQCNSRVQSMSLSLVCRLSGGDESELRLYPLINKNFVPRILRALTLFPLDPNLQADGCLALRNLAMSEAEKQIVALGGFNIIFLSLFNHPTNSCVQIEGTAALHNLACEESSRVFIQNDRLFGVRMILRTMQLSPNSIEIQLRCIRFLRNICHNAPSFLQRRMVVGDPPDYYISLPSCKIIPPIFQVNKPPEFIKYKDIKSQLFNNLQKIDDIIEDVENIDFFDNYDSEASTDECDFEDDTEFEIADHEFFDNLDIESSSSDEEEYHAPIIENSLELLSSIDSTSVYDVKSLIDAFRASFENQNLNKPVLHTNLTATTDEDFYSPISKSNLGLSLVSSLKIDPFTLRSCTSESNSQFNFKNSKKQLMPNDIPILLNNDFYSAISNSSIMGDLLPPSQFTRFSSRCDASSSFLSGGPPQLRPSFNRSRSETYNPRPIINTQNNNINAPPSTPMISNVPDDGSICDLPATPPLTPPLTPIDPNFNDFYEFPYIPPQISSSAKVLTRRQTAPTSIASNIKAAFPNNNSLFSRFDVLPEENDALENASVSEIDLSNSEIKESTSRRQTLSSTLENNEFGSGSYKPNISALEAIIDSMTRFEFNESIQVEACWALASLAQFPWNKADMLTAGVLGKVLNVLKNNCDGLIKCKNNEILNSPSVVVHENALKLLSSLANHFPWSHCVWEMQQFQKPILNSNISAQSKSFERSSISSYPIQDLILSNETSISNISIVDKPKYSCSTLLSEINNLDEMLKVQKHKYRSENVYYFTFIFYKKTSNLIGNADRDLLEIEIEIHKLRNAIKNNVASLSNMCSSFNVSKYQAQASPCKHLLDDFSLINLKLDRYQFVPQASSIYSRFSSKFLALDNILSVPSDLRPSSVETVAKIFKEISSLDSRIQSEAGTLTTSVIPNSDPLKALSFDYDKNKTGFSLAITEVEKTVVDLDSVWGLPVTSWPSWADLPQFNLLHIRTMMYLNQGIGIDEHVIGSPNDPNFANIMRLLVICGVTIYPTGSCKQIFRFPSNLEKSENVVDLTSLRTLYQEIQQFLNLEMSTYLSTQSDLAKELLHEIANFIHF